MKKNRQISIPFGRGMRINQNHVDLRKKQLESRPTIRPNDNWSLDTARKYVESRLEDGVICPCCNRFTKVYKRRMNATMVRSLIWLVKASDEWREWVDVPNAAPKWILRSNQLPTLRWWGLVERLTKEAAKANNMTKHSGFWRPTQKGIDFANSNTLVPEFVLTLNGEPQNFVGPEVTVAECLGTKFNYAEIMGYEA